MKIVLTVHQFLPDFSAGTEILTFDTARELKRRGHDVLVWTAFPTGEPGGVDEYEYDGISVRRYFYNPLEASVGANVMENEYNNQQFGKIFSEFIQTHKPDLIHFFHLGRLSSSAIHAGAEQSIPMIMTATDFWLACPTNQLRLPDGSMCLGPDRGSVNCIRHITAATQGEDVNEKLERLPNFSVRLLAWAAKRSWWRESQYSPLVVALVDRIGFQRQAANLLEKVMVPTMLMAERLQYNGLERGKIQHQQYGINLSHIQTARRKTLKDVLRIAFIGTLYEHKGAHVLLEAVKHLDSRAPVHVSLYGNLSEFPDYVAYLRELAGDDTRIEFCGTFPNHSIGEIFENVDVLVVPSIWYENAPLVVYSAQATGTPVIATNLGGLSELVGHGDNGLLFEKGNDRELAAQIARLLDERELLANLSERARTPKSIPQYVDELETIYAETVSRKGARI